MIQCCVMTLAIVLGQAEAPVKPPAAKPTAPLAEKLRKLIVQLEDEALTVRNQAEEAIIKLGPDILDLLPIPTEKMQLELKTRLGRIRVVVQKEAIDAFSKPTTLTLQGEMKLSEAIAKIEKQTGNTLVDFRERFNQEAVDSVLKLDLAEVPFWKGIDSLLDAAELTVYNYSDAETAGKLPFVARSNQEAKRGERGIYAGLFRLEARNVESTRDLRTPAASGLRLTTDIAWEPRIRPILLQIPQADLKAVDESGGELAIDGETVIEVPIEGSNSGVELVIPLKLPKRSVTKIGSLKGKLTAVIPGRPETFQFSGLNTAKDVAQERGGVIVTLEQARKNDDLEEIRIRLKFDKSANALESHRGWIYNNEAYLLDKEGKQIESGGLEARLVEVNEVGLSYVFDLEGRKLSDCKFVYKTPAAIYKIPVDFEIREIELP